MRVIFGMGQYRSRSLKWQLGLADFAGEQPRQGAAHDVGDHGLNQFEFRGHDLIHLDRGFKADAGDKAEIAKGIEPGEAKTDAGEHIPDELGNARHGGRIGLAGGELADGFFLIEHESDGQLFNLRLVQIHERLIIVLIHRLEVAMLGGKGFDVVNEVFGAVWIHSFYSTSNRVRTGGAAMGPHKAARA